MGIDRESEEDTGMNEKSFKIGQRVRIIGPTTADTNIHTGKYFVIEEAKGVQWKNGPFQYCVGYSEHGSIYAWPASSLELAEPEYVTDGQTVKIAPVKHNHPVDELQGRLDAIKQYCDNIETRIGFRLEVLSINMDTLEERVVNRFEDDEKRLQALEGKAPEATSAQEREDTDYKLYGVICKKPGLGVYELAKELGWSSDKAYGSIRRLVRDGWVMAVRDGRSALKIMPVKWHEFLTPEEIEEIKKGDLA